MSDLKFVEYNRNLKYFARENRENSTKREWLFWNLILKNKKFMWYKFTRQKPIWAFILDFYCSKLSLWIEIDGKYHDNIVDYDRRRSWDINHYWIRVIRFSNEDVEKNINWVVKQLEIMIKNIENLNLTNIKK